MCADTEEQERIKKEKEELDRKEEGLIKRIAESKYQWWGSVLILSGLVATIFADREDTLSRAFLAAWFTLAGFAMGSTSPSDSSLISSKPLENSAAARVAYSPKAERSVSLL